MSVHPVPIRSVLIARSAFGVYYEPALNRAINELGVQSRIFETHAYFSGLCGRIQQHFLRGPAIQRANRDLIEAVNRDRPDVTLFYQGHHFGRATLKQIRASTFIAGIHNDNPFSERNVLFRYRLLKPALPFYNAYHPYRDNNVSEFQAAGIQWVKVLMSYYLPWLDYPRCLDSHEKKQWSCELVYAGHSEPDQRIECFSLAVREGVVTRIYGGPRYWKRALPSDVLPNVGSLSHLAGEDYRKALCGAKIAACFFSKWNKDQFTRRVFEIPACGVFMLAERTAIMQMLYEEGSEAEFFSSPAEFMDKLRFYLRHEDARRRIAAAGYRRATTSGYDIYSRMRQWLADVSQWREELNYQQRVLKGH